MKKIVLTGAAGNLGRILRAPLSGMAEELVSTDLVDELPDLAPNESYRRADLGDLSAMLPVIEGADMVVHFGALVDEAPWDKILHSNIIGAYNVWEAARQHGVRRVVYASSIHAVGMYPKTHTLDGTEPHRPDSYYGLAKCFSEDLARLFWEKQGIEAVCMRIYSAANVQNTRALGSWLSEGDLVRLVTRAIDTPVTGFTIVYGVSNNDRAPVDNRQAAFLGYVPEDNAEVFAKDLLSKAPPADPSDPAQMCHGGPFATVELGQGALSILLGDQGGEKSTPG